MVAVDVTDGLLAVTALGAGAIAYRAWRNRPGAGATPLAGILFGVGLWASGHLGEHYATGTLDLVLARLRWTGLIPVAFLWVAFALEYTGREELLRRRYAVAFAAWPALVVALLWLPDGMPFSVWGSFAAEAGPAFWAQVGVSYGLLAVGSVLLLVHVRRSEAPFRTQGLLVLAGLGSGWAGSVVSVFELFGTVHFHALPAGFALMGGFMLWAIVGTGLTSVAPIARSTVIERLAAGVVVIDADRQVTSVNPAARRLLGLSPDRSIVGRPATAVFADRPGLRGFIDGTGADPDDGEATRTLEVEDRVLDCELTPLRDGRDRFVGWVLLLYDLTEQRRRAARLERQNERLEKFTSVLSHDLRNPLSVARSQVELAREGADDPHLEAAVEAHERMEELIEDLLTLARGGDDSLDPTAVELSAIAERSWGSVPTADADLEVTTGATVRADPRRLRQLLENLFRNSIEHGSTGEREEDGPGITVTVGELPDGFYVADDGTGIDPDDRERVFEPGYSTGRAGTGLGLSVVEEIAAAHDWVVAVTESEGGGARFEFTGVETA
jgi:signal transduction histidine kinase